ncbi:MAG: acetate--CoA ligase family protein [Planctomycetes bacterium]|nr:acetate--CoA ligase family protein [Planctomycetota bacterium]
MLTGNMTIVNTINKIFANAVADNRKVLFEHEVYDILNTLEIETPEYAVYMQLPENVDIKSDKLVAKLVSRECFHKSDIGGIVFPENNSEEIKKAFDEIKNAAARANVRFDGVLFTERVQYKPELGRELLVSFKLDEAFGPVLASGIGGILTEFYGKNFKPGKALVLRPTCIFDEESTDEQLEHMLESFVLTKILEGKGRIKQKLIDRADIKALLKKLIFLAEFFAPTNPELKTGEDYVFEEFELNPVLISDNGKLCPVDALVRFSAKEEISPDKPLHKLEKLFDPQSALVIGVSAKGGNPGHIILNNLIESGAPKEKLWVLHPKETEILGVKCVKTIDELPEGIDIAILTIPASEQTVSIIEALVTKNKVHNLVIITGGFGEVKAGSDLQSRLEQIIKNSRSMHDKGVLVNGPNCLGIISKPGNYDTFFLPPYLFPQGENQKQTLASISQSGAFLAFQKSKIQNRIIPRYSISFGNQIDITVSDYLEYLGNDDNVALYSVVIEGFKKYDGRKFARVCKELSKKGKQILVWKSARTDVGAKAAQSHTAAIAGNYELFRQTVDALGIFEPRSLEDLDDLLYMFILLADRDVNGYNVGIASNAGFEATVASDFLGNLKLANFTADTQSIIKEALPGEFVDVHNPIDTTPLCDTANFAKIIKAVVADPGVDIIVASPTPPTSYLNTLPAGEGHVEDISRADSMPNEIIKIFKSSTKPLIAVVEGGYLYDPYRKMMEDAGIPVFKHIDQALMTMSTFVTQKIRK